MELDKDSDNQIIAVETFTPDLIGEYAECYNALVKKLTGVLAANRVTVIKKEISDMKKNEESVEGLKYMAVLSVLIDLSQQGWVFDIIEEKLVLKMETDNIDDELLEHTDWLVILDQSLKSWDISLRSASEKLFYRENDYRSVGIYSANCNKFVRGYDMLVKQLGNFIPQNTGIKRVIEAIRNINDDGLLSIVSHKSNKIFDEKHGKGSLGTAIAAIHYKYLNPETILVGLDTQLAQEWLSDRSEGELPDLVAINLHDDRTVTVDSSQ